MYETRCNPGARDPLRDVFHRGNRELQDQFDTRPLAERLAERTEQRSRRISEADREFIETRDTFFFLATADTEGRPKKSQPCRHRYLDELIDELAKGNDGGGDAI